MLVCELDGVLMLFFCLYKKKYRTINTHEKYVCFGYDWEKFFAPVSVIIVVVLSVTVYENQLTPLMTSQV